MKSKNINKEQKSNGDSRAIAICRESRPSGTFKSHIIQGPFIPVLSFYNPLTHLKGKGIFEKTFESQTGSVTNDQPFATGQCG